MNLQHCLIWELKLGFNTMEAAKNLCYEKGQSAVDNSPVQEICLSCKNLDDQAMSGRTKTLDFKSMLQAIKARRGISSKYGILQSRAVLSFITW